MTFTTINPATNEKIRDWEEHSPPELDRMVDTATTAFRSWRRVPFAERAAMMAKAGDLLEQRAGAFAEIMAREMGKPITEGEGESKKCAWVCRFYAEKAEEFLRPVPAQSDGSEAWVRYDPLGPILAIMPWNYPFWQVFRFAAPNLMAGNVGILKHASNVPECALAIEAIFREAGCPPGVFQSVLISGRRANDLIADRRVQGMTITGSTVAGKKVAETAGRSLKPMVLELGGSDPFIVLEDADVAEAAKAGVTARCLNSGQSCIAAKRFIVRREVLREFTQAFVAAMEARVMGDPMKREVNIGPQARPDLRDELAGQVDRSVKAGARVLCGGKVPPQAGAWYPGTVLDNVRPGMVAADEELFGPVAAIIECGSDDEALAIANGTVFGLGASLWTRDLSRARRMVPEIEAGAVFVNGLVKSDPRLPFGGIRESGFGRELAREGILEFVNTKTVWIR